MRGDLTAWASAAAADLGRPEGRLFLLALVVSLPVTPEGQAERSRYLQHRLDGIREIVGRAADRGENPPDAEVIVDAIMGPLYLRVLWGFLPTDPGYPRSLVDRLLGVTARDGELDRRDDSRPAPLEGHEITLTPQYRDLVPEDQGLRVLRGVTARQEQQPAEHPDADTRCGTGRGSECRANEAQSPHLPVSRISASPSEPRPP